MSEVRKTLKKNLKSIVKLFSSHNGPTLGNYSLENSIFGFIIEQSHFKIDVSMSAIIANSL